MVVSLLLVIFCQLLSIMQLKDNLKVLSRFLQKFNIVYEDFNQIKNLNCSNFNLPFFYLSFYQT